MIFHFVHLVLLYIISGMIFHFCLNSLFFHACLLCIMPGILFDVLGQCKHHNNKLIVIHIVFVRNVALSRRIGQWGLRILSYI